MNEKQIPTIDLTTDTILCKGQGKWEFRHSPDGLPYLLWADEGKPRFILLKATIFREMLPWLIRQKVSYFEFDETRNIISKPFLRFYCGNHLIEIFCMSRLSVKEIERLLTCYQKQRLSYIVTPAGIFSIDSTGND